MNPTTSPTPDPVSIVTFRDAVGLAMVVADEYAFANVAAVLDEQGDLVEFAVTEGIGQTIEPIVAWAVAAPARAPTAEASGSGSGVLLLSVRPYEVDIVHQQDLRLFRTARWALACAGLHLVDWIETDGDMFRSYAYVTCPSDAWVDDPLAERLSDHQPF